MQKIYQFQLILGMCLCVGETSTTPLSPGSPADDSSGEQPHPNKSRLQRIKPQSRKTFRLRKSRKNNHTEVVSL